MAAGDDQPVTSSRTGLLINRAWVEPGSSSPLRAQIRFTIDVLDGFEHSLTVVQEQAAVEAVQAWLLEMLAGSRDVGNGSDSP
jgi:hypothetical protein